VRPPGAVSPTGETILLVPTPHGEFNCISLDIQSTRTVYFEWVNISRVNVFVSEPKFTKCFLSGVRGIAVDNAVFSLPMALSAPEILAIEVCKFLEIAPNFGRYLPCQITGGRGLAHTLYSNCNACLGARDVEKVPEVTPAGRRVITANTLNFKDIFQCLLLKIVGRDPVPGGVCASKLWSFSSVCKNLRGQHPLEAVMWSSKN